MCAALFKLKVSTASPSPDCGYLGQTSRESELEQTHHQLKNNWTKWSGEETKETYCWTWSTYGKEERSYGGGGRRVPLREGGLKG